MSLNVLMDNGFEDELDATFGEEEEVTHDHIMEIGSKLFLALYAQKQSARAQNCEQLVRLKIVRGEYK